MMYQWKISNEHLMKTCIIIHTKSNVTGLSNLSQQNSLTIANEYCVPTVSSLHHSPATDTTKHSIWIVHSGIVDTLAEIIEYAQGQVQETYAI